MESCVVEIIPNSFYFMISDKIPDNTETKVFFNIDNTFLYERFFADFGPLNLGQLYRYCIMVRDKMEVATFEFPDLISYRDASFGHNQYPLLVYDCINGLLKATKAGILNIDKFNLEEYEKYEHIKDGDMKWIVPGKLLAFSGPLDVSRGLIGGNVTWTTKQYGIRHHDLYFPDGSTPSERIVREFLSIVDNSYGGVAVHCKAGLGRTGSLIGCYLISHYDFTAPEAIGYMRLCRPGSVLGNQQYWLSSMESILNNKIIFQDNLSYSNNSSIKKPMSSSVRSFYKLKPITVISPQINRNSITSSSNKSRLSLQFTSCNNNKPKKSPPRSQTPKYLKYSKSTRMMSNRNNKISVNSASLNKARNTPISTKQKTSRVTTASNSSQKYPVISQSLSYRPHKYS